MEGIDMPLGENSAPWVPHCNSKGRDAAAIDAMPATVTVYVYGLGVWYLVNGSQRGLMKFLREESHTLSIRIIEKAADGTVASDSTVTSPMTQDVIFIAGDKPQRTRIELNERMAFDRWNWQFNDPEDMRWLVDITNDVHGGVPVVPIPNDKTLTPMTVHNALFYTKNFSDYNMDIIDETGKIVEDHFGAVGCVVGAKIEADSVRIYQKDVIDKTLVKVPNYTHEIHIFNQGADVVSDFYKYYWILGEQSPIPRKFDLIPQGGSVMSGEVVCASVKGDGEGDPGNGGG